MELSEAKDLRAVSRGWIWGRTEKVTRKPNSRVFTSLQNNLSWHRIWLYMRTCRGFSPQPDSGLRIWVGIPVPPPTSWFLNLPLWPSVSLSVRCGESSLPYLAVARTESVPGTSQAFNHGVGGCHMCLGHSQKLHSGCSWVVYRARSLFLLHQFPFQVLCWGSCTRDRGTGENQWLNVRSSLLRGRNPGKSHSNRWPGFGPTYRLQLKQSQLWRPGDGEGIRERTANEGQGCFPVSKSDSQLLFSAFSSWYREKHPREWGFLLWA